MVTLRNERAVLLELLEKQKHRFVVDGAKPWELAANNPDQPPELPSSSTPSDAAAWTVVSRVLLNLDETVTKE